MRLPRRPQPGTGDASGRDAGVRRPPLSLNEWAVLAVLVERPRHGYDVAAELRPGTPIGDTWRVSRPLVYRALERLEELGLAGPRRTEQGEAGPPRTVHGATRRGRAALHAWLDTPVEHLREARTALLLKLVLLDRLARPRDPLVRAQRAVFEPLLTRLRTPPEPGDVTALWRHHAAAATGAFLDALDGDRGGGRRRHR